jgi:alkaline phosphatase D
MFSPGRRRFIATTSLSFAALAVSGCTRDSRDTGGPVGPVEVDRRYFPQSVASGDPRPDRVLLWTRVAGSGTLPAVLLQVADDNRFSAVHSSRALMPSAEHGGCLRLRLTGLQPGRDYYYRFLVETDQGWRSSPVGRTRTAPSADSDAPLRFALLSCQDYGGRWYNSLLPLLNESLDFLLHVGDFIYETAGDPSFQGDGPERRIVFDDLAGALQMGSTDRPYFAARSLDNYRQLHRTVRSDEVIQALLERAPLVAIWDDHEFADDSWQDVATHFDGRSNEQDRERRRNSEQAWMEYMPVDLDALDEDGGVPPREALFPALRIWRGLRFGRVLDLSLTDSRSERPDHLVPEDAFPGEVIFDEAELRQRLPDVGIEFASIEGSLLPWIDLALPEHAALRPTLVGLLTAGYTAEGLDSAAAAARAQSAAQGRIALPVLSALLQRWNASAPEAMRVPLPAAESAGGRGLAWASLGKTGLFSSVGSRYFVVQAPWQAVAALRAAEATPFSAAQRDWLLQRLRDSDAVWKAVASSISFTPIELDLSLPELGAPPLLARRFLLNVDHWDGFPDARRSLIEQFESAGGALLLSGDIHAAFATQHAPRTVELTTPAISSTTLADILSREVEREPATAEVGRRMVDGLDALIVHGDPRVALARTREHGVVLVEADRHSLRARFLCQSNAANGTRLYDAPDRVPDRREHVFEIDAASRALRQPGKA